MGRNKISISVAGSEFIVSTDEDRAYTLSLASTVDRKIREMLASSDKLSVNMAAILCCLDLCDENEKNKQSCARLREEIRRYLVQVESSGVSNGKDRSEMEEKIKKLTEENQLLRSRLRQYEMGQIGFNS